FLLLDRSHLPPLVPTICTISVVYNSLHSLFLPVCSTTIGLKVPTGPGGRCRCASAEAAGRREGRVGCRGFCAVQAPIRGLYSTRLRSDSPDCAVGGNHCRTQSPDRDRADDRGGQSPALRYRGHA